MACACWHAKQFPEKAVAPKKYSKAAKPEKGHSVECSSQIPGRKMLELEHAVEYIDAEGSRLRTTKRVNGLIPYAYLLRKRKGEKEVQLTQMDMRLFETEKISLEILGKLAKRMADKEFANLDEMKDEKEKLMAKALGIASDRESTADAPPRWKKAPTVRETFPPGAPAPLETLPPASPTGNPPGHQHLLVSPGNPANSSDSRDSGNEMGSEESEEEEDACAPEHCEPEPAPQVAAVAVDSDSDSDSESGTGTS